MSQRANQRRQFAMGFRDLEFVFDQYGEVAGFEFTGLLDGEYIRIKVIRLNQAPYHKPYRLVTTWDQYSIPMTADDVLGLRRWNYGEEE